MSSEWNTTTIGAVCLKVFSGGTPKSTSDEYYGGSIPWLRTKEVNYGRVYETEQHITQLGFENSSAKLVPVNSVIVAMYGNGDTAGRVAINKIPLTTNQACCNLVVDPEKADFRFVYYYLKGRYQELVDLKNGGAQQNLNGQLIKAFPFVAPDLNEQEVIASTLEALDDRITLLRETNATLEAIAQALFKSWFVDFDPVRAKMDGRAPEGMDVDTAALFPDSFEESELGLVPRGWAVQAVGELLVPKRGKSITKSKCIEGDIPVVAGGLEPAYFHNQCNVSNPVVTISASGANAGFVRLYQQDIWASDCSFVSSEQTDTVYFWYVFLKSNQENIYFMQQGAAQPHIYPSDLIRLSICSPKSNEMRNIFNSLVSPLFKRIGLANAKIQTLSNMRDTLLPRLISGQLRVNELTE